MAFDIGIGGGRTVRIEEPPRPEGSRRLGDWTSYALAHGLYTMLRIAGNAMGEFMAGVAVTFLERLEPALVDYAAPILDLVLSMPDIEPHIRTFLQQLRHPTHAAGGEILLGLAGQVGGGIVGTALTSALAGLTYALNRANRPALPSVSDIYNMKRRGVRLDYTSDYIMASLGYHDDYMRGYEEITRARLAPSDLIRAYQRGTMARATAEGELRGAGLTASEIASVFDNAIPRLGLGEAVSAYHRNLISASDLDRRLGNMGYEARDIGLLRNVMRPIPGPGDLVHMAVREAWRDDIASRWSYDEDRPSAFGDYMAQWGYDQKWSVYYWRAHWALPSLTQGYEMLHRGFIQQREMETLLRVSDIPAFWRGKLLDISYNPLTRVDVRRMYGLGVLNRNDVKRSYLDLGYSDLNAERMTQFTLLYEADDPQSKLTEYKSLSKSVVLAAYKKGLMDRGETTTQLLGLAYTANDVNMLLSIADWQTVIEQTPDYQEDYKRDMRSIVEKAYSRRLIGRSNATATLNGLGYGLTEAEYLLYSVDFWYSFEQINGQLKAVGDAYIARALNRTDVVGRLGALNIPGEMQAQVLTEWDSARNLRTRRLTESQYRKAMTDGIISSAEYAEAMRGLGYTDPDIWILQALALGAEAAGGKPSTGVLII